MVEISLNGKTVEAEPGRRLVEVIKEQGITITNLCYIDGLEPYAGCRTCIVDIEGGRPSSLQLSCTAQITEGQVVQTDTPEVKQARQSVMSVILANHPDRCLTCHRRVHCMPGDICLRDDVVTHRCLTCSKNYRCELQTSCENVDQGDFSEPWVGEKRSYYETPPPEPDRANPFLEFDPQMCIICTRCVRACDELRHTGALALSGKGHTTMIAFGTGGQIHESDCDFCGACIDVCPTATLMEKPNKWNGRADDWTSAVCNSCSVGCTITYGTSDQVGSDNIPVIVRPERINPVSQDQICVRGRFGYDAIGPEDRLTTSLERQNDRMVPKTLSDATSLAVDQLKSVISSHGPRAIGLLGSPLSTTEEAMGLAALADSIGTPNIDFSHGAIHRSVLSSLDQAFGTSRLSADLTDIENSSRLVVIATDLEESHPGVSLRIKGAARKNQAKVILVSPRWSELDRFAASVLRCYPGTEANVVDSLGKLETEPPSGITAEQWNVALTIVRSNEEFSDDITSVVFAPNAIDGEIAGGLASAACNLTIGMVGNTTAEHLFYLPVDGNTHGVHDAGIAPRAGGKSFQEMMLGAISGSIKALVIHDDNPILNSPDTDTILSALSNLESLVVIDSVKSTLSEYATVMLSEAAFYHRSGSITTADRRVLLHNSIDIGVEKEKSGIEIIKRIAAGLGFELDRVFSYSSLAEYPSEASVVQQQGHSRAIPDQSEMKAAVQDIDLPLMEKVDNLAVFTSRSLYTSWDGASSASEEADKLDREGTAWVNPADALDAGVTSGAVVTLQNGSHSITMKVKLDDGVAAGTVYVPSYYRGGAIMSLFDFEGLAGGLPSVKLIAADA